MIGDRTQLKGIANVLGHPVHPMLVTLPLGLLPFSVVSDVVYLLTKKELAAGISYYATKGGLAGGLLAGVFGLMDWTAIPNHTRAKRIGTFGPFHVIAEVHRHQLVQ